MKIASLFSGIGGFEKGLQQADPTIERVFSSEIDKYARQIYKKNFGVEPHGDITEIDATDIPDHDILCGGFPCQAFSIAGKRRGFEDTRGTLFFEIMRVAEAKRPKLLFLENVKGILSHDRGRTFQTILRSMDDMGYDAEWQVFNSKNHGVPQNRERVFIIGHLRGSGTRPIFPITESIERAHEGAEYPPINTLTAGGHSGGSPSSMTLICDSGLSRKKQLRSEIVPPLRANTGAGHNNLVVDATPRCECGTPSATCIPVLTPDRETKRQAGRRFKDNGDPSFTVTAQDRHGIMTDNNIRRLTPTECERLQGFPDGWTEYGTKVLTTVQIHGNVWDQISVQSMDAIEKLSTVNRDYVLCTINDGKSGEIQISHILPNEKTNRCAILMDVIAPHIVEKCVCDIISHGNDMVIHYNHKERLKIKKETLKNHISESMGGNYTKPLLRIILDEKLELAKSSTILTWIKEIMKCQTFIYAKTDRPITDAIIYWSSVPQNLSEKDSLFLKMENTIKISDTQRYRCLGNAVTVNVVEYISRHLLDMLHQC